MALWILPNLFCKKEDAIGAEEMDGLDFNNPEQVIQNTLLIIYKLNIFSICNFTDETVHGQTAIAHAKGLSK